MAKVLVTGSSDVVVGDVSSLNAIRDGLSQLWTVNVLTPYLLTALIDRPKRLVYISSGMHVGGSPDLRDAQWSKRRWDGVQVYSDSKLHKVLLAFGIGGHWDDVRVAIPQR